MAHRHLKTDHKHATR